MIFLAIFINMTFYRYFYRHFHNIQTLTFFVNSNLKSWWQMALMVLIKEAEELRRWGDFEFWSCTAVKGAQT